MEVVSKQYPSEKMRLATRLTCTEITPIFVNLPKTEFEIFCQSQLYGLNSVNSRRIVDLNDNPDPTNKACLLACLINR
jgi:hypothetical protein